MEVPDRPSKPKAILAGNKIKVRSPLVAKSWRDPEMLAHSWNGQNGPHGSG